jgi:hypothetical protein
MRIKNKSEIEAELAHQYEEQTKYVNQLNSLTQMESIEFGDAVVLNRDVTKGKIEALKWVLNQPY